MTARTDPSFLRNVLFLVGPTASGKTELGADVAIKLGAEIVSADAFQIYDGLDLLTAKPDAAILTKVPHHLVGAISLDREMNADRFRLLARAAIAEINSRKKAAMVVGGSGLYVKALTHGLSPLPKADPKLRTEFDKMSLKQLHRKLIQLDPEAALTVDLKNRRRVTRALEIALLTGRPLAHQRAGTRPGISQGVFVFRDRDELYERINRRVEFMFEQGVIEEVKRAPAVGLTASQMIGLADIRQMLNGQISRSECIARIQQATRRYAKRQLTWFRRQTNFETLNLSLLSRGEAAGRIAQLAKTFGVGQRG